MKAVLKFQLAPGQGVVEGPKPLRIVAAGFQGDQAETVVLWAECDTDRPTGRRLVYIAGTGWPVPDGYEYAVTAQDPAFPFVFHVFQQLHEEI